MPVGVSEYYVYYASVFIVFVTKPSLIPSFRYWS